MRKKEVRRLTLTASFDPNDPVESRFIELYDTIPKHGYRRVDFLRRCLLIGVMTQTLLDRKDIRDDMSKQIAREL